MGNQVLQKTPIFTREATHKPFQNLVVGTLANDPSLLFVAKCSIDWTR